MKLHKVLVLVLVFVLCFAANCFTVNCFAAASEPDSDAGSDYSIQFMDFSFSESGELTLVFNFTGSLDDLSINRYNNRWENYKLFWDNEGDYPAVQAVLGEPGENLLYVTINDPVSEFPDITNLEFNIDWNLSCIRIDMNKGTVDEVEDGYVPGCSEIVFRDYSFSESGELTAFDFAGDPDSLRINLSDGEDYNLLWSWENTGDSPSEDAIDVVCGYPDEPVLYVTVHDPASEIPDTGYITLFSGISGEYMCTVYIDIANGIIYEEESEQSSSGEIYFQDYSFSESGELTLVFDYTGSIDDLSIQRFNDKMGYWDFYWFPADDTDDSPGTGAIEASLGLDGENLLYVTVRNPADEFPGITYLKFIADLNFSYICIDTENGIVYEGEPDYSNYDYSHVGQTATFWYYEYSNTGELTVVCKNFSGNSLDDLWIWRFDDDGGNWYPYWNIAGEFPGEGKVNVFSSEEDLLFITFNDPLSECPNPALFALDIPGKEPSFFIIDIENNNIDSVDGGGDRTGADRFPMRDIINKPGGGDKNDGGTGGTPSNGGTPAGGGNNPQGSDGDSMGIIPTRNPPSNSNNLFVNNPTPPTTTTNIDGKTEQSEDNKNNTSAGNNPPNTTAVYDTYSGEPNTDVADVQTGNDITTQNQDAGETLHDTNVPLAPPASFSGLAENPETTTSQNNAKQSNSEPQTKQPVLKSIDNAQNVSRNSSPQQDSGATETQPEVPKPPANINTAAQNNSEPQTEQVEQTKQPILASTDAQTVITNPSSQPEVPKPPVNTNTALLITGIVAVVLAGVGIFIKIYGVRKL
ncbi:MAG: hypothetical protein FWD71_19280 [Oscillospiraceae bacterium]|nr:hypothetical protein [Oscillospiraceae bacterium]